MITIISGVPGSGKTALVVDMIMAEIKQGRRVYTNGIPDLLLNVHQGGDPLKWQDGTWLEIDRFNPVLTRKKGIQGEWFPRTCPSSCEFLSTCPNKFMPHRDNGALWIIDESHIVFPQRPSGKEPPPYVQALSVHRHCGLDIWFISQRPSFLDPFVRGLASRHIHIGLSFFSMFGERVKYEWPEYMEVVNRSAKTLAAKSKYKPAPHVFPLYKSATIHTTLDQRMPNVLKTLAVLGVVMVVMVGYLYQRASQRYTDVTSPQVAQGPVKPVQPVQQPVQAVNVQDQTKSAAGGVVDVPMASQQSAPVSDTRLISACIATAGRCQCYTHHGIRLSMPDLECRLASQSPNEKFRLEVPAPVLVEKLADL